MATKPIDVTETVPGRAGEGLHSRTGEMPVSVHHPDAEGALTEPTPMTIADPGPLGLAAFAMTTFMLSVFNANIISTAALQAVVLPLALFYGGLGQLLAGMWEFRKGNTFGALAFTSYGAFWMSFAAYVKFVVPGLPASTEHQATGLFLLSWTIFTAYMLIASTRVSAAVCAVFAFLTPTFLFLTIGALGQHPTITHIGGWLGLITAVLAWYASAAGVTNSTYGKTVLPTFPLAR